MGSPRLEVDLMDGHGAWDAELHMADSLNYMTKEMFDKLGFIRVDYGDYGRNMVKDVGVEIHGFTFLVDFVAIRNPTSILYCTTTTHIPSTIPKQKEKIKEALDQKYKELEESMPILEVLENYMTYRKKLDEVTTGCARLSSDEFGEEEKMRIVEQGLLKKICDPGNFVLPVRVNCMVQMIALADTGEIESVLPYSLFKNLGLSDPKPYNSNLIMGDNTQAKSIGEVRNVRIQIRYQAYLVDFLVLDIPMDNELPLLLGRLFLRTCGAVDDWLSCFKVGRDEDGNPKYGLVAPSFFDIKDNMERVVAMEAYFNPFKNIIVFKKLIDFLGSLPVQFKNTDWAIKFMEFTRRLKVMELSTPNLKFKGFPEQTTVETVTNMTLENRAHFESEKEMIHLILTGIGDEIYSTVDESKKITIKKSEKELEMFEALGHKSVVVKSKKHRVVVFTKAPHHAYSKPFMRFSTPCGVDGHGAWDAELHMADSLNYMTKEMFDKLGFIRVDYGDYGRNMVKDVGVEIHGFTFLVDFVAIRVGEMRIDLTLLEEERDMEALLLGLVENMEEVGKIPPVSFIAPPPPIYHPLSQKQKEKIKEALDQKYKELEESMPILEVLENYMTYRKKLDEVTTGCARLSSDEFGEEEKMRIVEQGLLKKICDPGNFVLPVRVNCMVQMIALADTGEIESVLPYSLFKNLGLSDPRPYNSNLIMGDNTQAKSIGEVRNVRIQIRYQAYLVDFLVLDIPMDNELPLLLGRLFLRTCGAVIDIWHGTMSIDNGFIRHTHFPKPRAKGYLENFEIDKEDDWLSCFKVGRDEDGNPKYGLVAPSFFDIKDNMERVVAMEAYFNPFKNIIVFKKLIDFLGSLPVQFKNTDWAIKFMEFTRRLKVMELSTPNLK
ncbi:DNA-directed DNA polymerase [Tanacetum coccineum]|uniref:DNA-directed DNA polymerase n=1 Tax=Tanacetum coccineum TaxID=301880 RepID=A0ABQ5GQJ9_9ASTR